MVCESEEPATLTEWAYLFREREKKERDTERQKEREKKTERKKE